MKKRKKERQEQEMAAYIVSQQAFDSLLMVWHIAKLFCLVWWSLS